MRVTAAFEREVSAGFFRQVAELQFFVLEYLEIHLGA
jgi:hypothetical protein